MDLVEGEQIAIEGKYGIQGGKRSMSTYAEK